MNWVCYKERKDEIDCAHSREIVILHSSLWYNMRDLALNLGVFDTTPSNWAASA